MSPQYQVDTPVNIAVTLNGSCLYLYILSNVAITTKEKEAMILRGIKGAISGELEGGKERGKMK